MNKFDFLDQHAPQVIYNPETDILIAEVCQHWQCSYSKAVSDMDAFASQGIFEKFVRVMLPNHRLGTIYRMKKPAN